jgi:hypothetical protein
MAEHKRAIIIPKMHTISLALIKDITFRTRPRFHPFMIAVWLKAMDPYIPKRISIDIALMILASYT